MNRPRSLFVAGLGLLVLGGCTNRECEVTVQELQDDNARLTAEMNALEQTARDLETERNYLREDNQRLSEQAEGLSEQLKGLLNRAEGDLNMPGVTVRKGEGSIALEQDFAFAKGSAELNEQGLAVIAKLAQLLNEGEYQQTLVTVEGHTDDTPVVRRPTVEKFGDNWGLSAMRAASVVRALQEDGIGPARLRGAFRGQHQPRSASDKAANRRVEIYLSL